MCNVSGLQCGPLFTPAVLLMTGFVDCRLPSRRRLSYNCPCQANSSIHWHTLEKGKGPVAAGVAAAAVAPAQPANVRQYPSSKGPKDWSKVEGECHTQSLSFALRPTQLPLKQCSAAVRFGQLLLPLLLSVLLHPLMLCWLCCCAPVCLPASACSRGEGVGGEG